MNVLCFYMFGTLSFFNQELLFIASQDILSGRKLPTATILVCFVTPLMITKILAPWFVQRIPYVVKTCIIALDMALGLTLIVFVENMEVKLLGICLNAMATGSAEVVFLGLSSFYQPICISSYVAGTGMASLFSPLYYNALTTWSCVSPKTAIMITIPFPALWLVFYFILDKSYISNEPQGAQKRTEIKYTSLKNSPDESANRPTTIGGIFSCTEQLRIAFKILPFILSLFLSFFAEYLSNSSVITSIAFPDSKLHPRDHFLVYFLSYMLGKFVGRSHLFIFSFLPSEATEFLMCDKTWIFAVLEMGHLLFFLFESWYHFLPSIWIMVVLCSTLGLVAGIIVVQSPHAVSRNVSPEEKEFALGLLTIGNGVGGFLAGLVGLAVEPFLTNECKVHFSATKEFCFTRLRNATGWEKNFHC